MPGEVVQGEADSIRLPLEPAPVDFHTHPIGAAPRLTLNDLETWMLSGVQAKCIGISSTKGEHTVKCYERGPTFSTYVREYQELIDDLFELVSLGQKLDPAEMKPIDQRIKDTSERQIKELKLPSKEGMVTACEIVCRQRGIQP